MSIGKTKVGLVLPQWEGAQGGETARGEQLMTFARTAEDAGFDSLWTVDHLRFEFRDFFESTKEPVPEELEGMKLGFWECWTLLSAVAAATRRVEIGTLVSCTGYRNPALLARMANTVDELSGGRLILGLGAGMIRTDYEAHGFDTWERKVGRFEEALQIIRPLLRGESVSFEGEFYRMREAQLLPKAERPGGPPVLIGFVHGGPRMQRLIAEHADHWNCWIANSSSFEHYEEVRDTLFAGCERNGRDPRTLIQNLTVGVCLPGHQPHGEPISGSTAEITRELERFVTAGVDHITVNLEPNTLDGIEKLSQIIEATDGR